MNQLAALYTLRPAAILCNKSQHIPETFLEQVNHCLSDAGVDSRTLEEAILVYDAARLCHARLIQNVFKPSADPSTETTETNTTSHSGSSNTKRKATGEGNASTTTTSKTGTPLFVKKHKSGKMSNIDNIGATGGIMRYSLTSWQSLFRNKATNTY